MKSPIRRHAGVGFSALMAFLFLVTAIAIFGSMAHDTLTQVEDDQKLEDAKQSSNSAEAEYVMRIENDPNSLSRVIRDLNRIESRLETGIESSTILVAIRHIGDAIRSIEDRLEELQDDD